MKVNMKRARGWEEKLGREFETKEILYDGHYYNVTEFIENHPGGKGIINFFTGKGEDATLHIQQFHSASMSKVEGIMKSLKRRPPTDADILAFGDRKTRERNKMLTDGFTKLYLELKAEGAFEPSYFHIAYRILEMVLLGAIGFYLVTHAATMVTKGVGCIFLTLGQIRALGVMHEGGHLSLTRNPKWDRIIQTFSFGCFFGISPTYWRRHHYFHHAQTSRVKYDVDFETLPLIVLNMAVVDNPKKDQNFMIRNPIIFGPFVVILYFWYLQFWKVGRSLLKYRVPSELLAVGMYHFFAWHLGLWPLLIVTFMTTNYFAANTTINHSHLPVNHESSHWVEQSLNHSVDIKPCLGIDWWMIHLNYQIEHHLFPTMPQFNNHLAVERVKAFAKEHGLPYHVYSYTEAFIKNIKNILHVSGELKKIH